MKAIRTKYLGPTDKLWKRIRASDGSGNSLTVEYNDDMEEEVNHIAAAIQFQQKMQWFERIETGWLENGVYVHVQIESVK